MSWAEIPLVFRSIFAIVPNKGRGILLFTGYNCCLNEYCPPCGPLLNNGWWIAIKVVLVAFFLMRLSNSWKNCSLVLILQLSFIVGLSSQFSRYHCESTIIKIISSEIVTFLRGHPFLGKNAFLSFSFFLI